MTFPAPSRSGHIEKSSLKKQHLDAIADATRILKEHTVSEEAKFEGFECSRLRHTCLTRWAPHMDPWTLGYLAGHRDMNISAMFIRRSRQFAAIDRAQAGESEHTVCRRNGDVNQEIRQLIEAT